VLAIVVTALLFDPVRKWIQGRIDQVFYRTGYDYRKTLIEFGRELSSETDLDKMLSAVVDRLSRTLLVDRMAVFVSEGETSQQFVVAKSFGMTQTSGLDLSFLGTPRPEDAVGHSVLRQHPPSSHERR
jgi:two-component system, NtrC family, sensor kinase